MPASVSDSQPDNALTEEEASRYDRQMRLWGLEAQQRMRNATILVIGLQGTATETIKNIVLAGIGRLIIVDNRKVSEVDLGAGFFFRDEDVGRKRLDCSKSRIEGLNPLVSVETITTLSNLEGKEFEQLVSAVDLVCVTDWYRDGLIRLNELCREKGKLFYAGGTYGFFGYIFCDLLKHEYIESDRSSAADIPKMINKTAVYPLLSHALRHRWSHMTKRQLKEVNPAVLFSILAVWKYQSRHNGSLPDEEIAFQELKHDADTIIREADVNQEVKTDDLLRSLSITAAHEFSPVCAVVGGMLAQDILKALSAREPPIANFFTFDGNTGTGTVTRLGLD